MARRYEPSPCYAPSCSVVNGELCMWGGKLIATNHVKIYNPFLESWRKLPTRGSKPRGLYGGASAQHGHCLYVYGGIEASGSLNGNLHRLDLLDTELSPSWTRVAAHSEDGPMKKAKSGMIMYDNSLILVGGYAVRNNLRESDYLWAFEKEKAVGNLQARGYTNEIHKYEQKKWSSIQCTGTRPPPCSDFSLTMIDLHGVVLFGGIQKCDGGNDTYFLDLPSMIWSRLSTCDADSVVMRYSHTAVCLNYCGEQPQLFILGGRTAHAVLNDALMLDVQSGSLEPISLPNFEPRHSHCAAAFSLSPGISEVVAFAGCRATGTVREDRFIADTNVLRFQKNMSDSQAKWSLTNKANKFQRGIRSRIREKITKTSHMAHDVYWEKTEATKTQLEEKARVLELQAELEKQEKSWIVPRKDIHFSDESLGKGAWAEVKEAEFRGQKVAAKVLHKYLDCKHVRELFKREMKIASLIRCPNLVQFIAASVDEELIILMELLPTSLRKHLEKNAGTIQPAAFRVSISMDVAKALNYLHLMQPDPIIHRDISSANVLLEPLANAKWRAKVSDYGSANIKCQTETENPGCPAYSPPEADIPSNQTLKMDIFSYGVLLIEICTSRFPFAEERENMLLSIEENHWVEVIRKCIVEDQAQRPTAHQIISMIQDW